MIWTVVSWCACALGFAGTWAALRHPTGWLVLLASNLAWVLSETFMHIWAGVAASGIGTLICARNWHASRKTVTS